MASNNVWAKVRLGDIGRIITGKTPPSSVAGCFDGTTLFITPSDMDGRKTISGTQRCLSHAGVSTVGKVLIPKNSVMVSCIGSDLGKVALAGDECVTNQQINSIVTNNDVDPEFVYYSLLPRKKEFRDFASGSAQPIINKSHFSEIKINLPPLKEQRHIARILGSLDDKIDLNRRMNETLEATARAIFQSWFVNFDPVRAKTEGRQPFGMDSETAALFPDLLEESEMGQIPQGWGILPFANTVEILGGGTPKTSISEFWDGNIPWFSVADAPSDGDVFVIDTEKKITNEGLEKSSATVLSEGTTIITARGTVGKVALVGVPMAMNQSCYGLHGKHEKEGFFTYFSTLRLVSTLKQHAHGSVFDTITRDTFAGVNVAMPPAELISAFEKTVTPLLGRIRLNCFESGTLGILRDTLLPKLLLGEIRLENALPT